MDDKNTQPKIETQEKSGPRHEGARSSFGGGARGGSRGSRSFADRPRPEFDNKMINIRRVTRVVAG